MTRLLQKHAVVAPSEGRGEEGSDALERARAELSAEREERER